MDAFLELKDSKSSRLRLNITVSGLVVAVQGVFHFGSFLRHQSTALLHTPRLSSLERGTQRFTTMGWLEECNGSAEGASDSGFLTQVVLTFLIPYPTHHRSSKQGASANLRPVSNRIICMPPSS